MRGGQKKPKASATGVPLPKSPKAASKESPGPPVPKAISALLRDDGTHLHPVFSFSMSDDAVGCEWGWHLLDSTDAHSLVVFIREMAKLPWSRIVTDRAGGRLRNHSQPITSLPPAPRRRLRELKLEDLDDQIFRFRLSGTQRLWGFCKDGVFYALWWDPNHRVYPADPN
jgi:hypothetical protein